MSYIPFRQRCNACKEEWNAAFGIVGNTQIAKPPVECPHCKSKDIEKIADHWVMNDGTAYPDYIKSQNLQSITAFN